MAKVREYVGYITLEKGVRKVVWPDGVDVHEACKVEVEFDGVKARMKVYEPEPSYDEIKAFIMKNVSWYAPEAVIDTKTITHKIFPDEDFEKYVLLNFDELAEFVKRYFIDAEPQESYPVKF